VNGEGECRAEDANEDERGSESGAASLVIEQLKFLSVAVVKLSENVERNSILMARLILKQSDLITALTEVDEVEDDEPEGIFDLRGNRVDGSV
jgi:methyl coenzyme M reductase subunit C